MPDDADRELVGCILGGGADGKVAFKKLYDRYQKSVFTICLRLMGDFDRAKDATQESFIAVLKGLGSFNFQSSLKTWIFRVTKNAALQQLRKSSSRVFLPLEEGEEGTSGRRHSSRHLHHESGHKDQREKTDLDRPDQLEAVIENEFEADLQQVINRLKKQHAEILSLRYFGGSSYEELSEILGCSIGTVKSRLNRAHKALKPYMIEVLKKHERQFADIQTSETREVEEEE